MAFREVLRPVPHPHPHPRPDPGDKRGDAKVLPGGPTPRVRGRDFHDATKEPRGGPGAGRGGGRPKERGPRPRAGSLSAGWALQGLPAGNSPCRVRKSRPESMPDGRAAGGGASGRTGPSRARRRDPKRLRGEESGGGPGTPPRPPGAPTRASPRPSWGSGGRVPARNSRMPPASSAAARRPWAPSLPRAVRPTPYLWAPLRVWGDARKNLASFWERDRVTSDARQSCCETGPGGAGRPAVAPRISAFPSAKWVHGHGLGGPQRGMPGSCPEEGPLLSPWKFLTPEAPLVGAGAQAGKAYSNWVQGTHL